jgi:CRISPR-associated endonuclease/helicase Cas3
MTSEGKSASLLAAALGLAQGESAFPWQRRLLGDLVRGDLPRALDLPTGMGKTSVMAIWLVARALGAPVPRRLVYVVDRRAVVDQATAVAEQLRDWVQSNEEVRLALGLDTPLPISTLRGQHVDNRAWLADPASPAIVLGTVDMVGSRLLFSGYGVSAKMRPYHAGLMGADTLVVLDEAHLVPPFEKLVRQIARGIDADGRPLGARASALPASVPPMRLLSLSATGRRSVEGQTFSLEEEDCQHPVVQQRLGAVKRLMLFAQVPAKELPETLAVHAWDLSGKGSRPTRVIVFVNSRDHALRIQQALDKLAGRSGLTELFVGGRRVYERELAAQRLQAMGFLAACAEQAEHPSFLIATSAGEVGVDLDAEHAVCDLVAWERMVQRLGRVNRRGRGDAAVVVVPAGSEDAAVQATQAAVIQLIQALPRHPDSSYDASPAALGTLKTHAEMLAAIERGSTPAPLHPPLQRASVEAWAMTSLETHTGRSEIEPWLRGWPDKEEPPQTTVVWRTHLPITEASPARLLGPKEMELFWDAAAPHLSEQLQVEMPQALEWLTRRAKALQTATVAGVPAEEALPPLAQSDVLAVVTRDGGADTQLLRASDLLSPRRKRDIERLLSGATLLVDRRVGGLVAGLLADEDEAAAVDVTEQGSDSAPGPVPFRLWRVTDDELEAPAPGWRTEATFTLKRADDGVSAWLVVRSRMDQQAESEEGRSGAQRSQGLLEHQSWTEAAARRIALSLDLPASMTEMMATAAMLHDEGKRAARWQQAFHAPSDGTSPYAKTIGRPDLAVLDGYRHEFGSLPYAEAHSRLRALDPELQDLCLHLIAAHHGAARPVIRMQGAEEPPSRAIQRARDVALRYARLSSTWGPWGLAWWEALLRAADQQASRRNDEEGSAHG